MLFRHFAGTKFYNFIAKVPVTVGPVYNRSPLIVAANC